MKKQFSLTRAALNVTLTPLVARLLCSSAIIFCYCSNALDSTNWIGAWSLHGSRVQWRSGGTFNGSDTSGSVSIAQTGPNSYFISAPGLSESLSGSGDILVGGSARPEGTELATRYLRVRWITNDLIVVTDTTAITITDAVYPTNLPAADTVVGYATRGNPGPVYQLDWAGNYHGVGFEFTADTAPPSMVPASYSHRLAPVGNGTYANESGTVFEPADGGLRRFTNWDEGDTHFEELWRMVQIPGNRSFWVYGEVAFTGTNNFLTLADFNAGVTQDRRPVLLFIPGETGTPPVHIPEGSTNTWTLLATNTDLYAWHYEFTPTSITGNYPWPNTNIPAWFPGTAIWNYSFGDIPGMGYWLWSPNEESGPSTFQVIITVQQNATPSLVASKTVTVIIDEVNQAPVLSAILPQTIRSGQTLTVTNAATDVDLPANPLTYELLAAPPGSTIAANGVIRWHTEDYTPPGTNTFITRVTDFNTWAPTNQQLSATNSFVVNVLPNVTPPAIDASSVQITNMQGTHYIGFKINATVPTNALVVYKDNLSGSQWLPLGPAQPATTVFDIFTTNRNRYYMIQVKP